MPQHQIDSTRSERVYEDLAIQSLNSGRYRNVRAAAKAYDVPYRTLLNRMAGTPSRASYVANSRKFSEADEDFLVAMILELNHRSWPPTFARITQFVDIIAMNKGIPTIGKRWSYNFVKRTP